MREAIGQWRLTYVFNCFEFIIPLNYEVIFALRYVVNIGNFWSFLLALSGI